MQRFFIPLFLLLLTGLLPAQQYTRIGVVNLSKVYESASVDTQAVKELEDLKVSIQKEVTRMSDELRQLEAKRVDEKSKGNEIGALNLESEIQQKQSYQKEYAKVKQAQYNAKRDALKQDSNFLANVVQKIKEISELKGFAMVLRSDDPNLIYYNLDTDITDDVIKRINPDN